MLRYHVEKRKEMEDLHARQLKQMRSEHERKKQADEEKFQALLEQKQSASEQFEETLQKLEMEQKELIDNMTYEHDAELERAREKVNELRE